MPTLQDLFITDNFSGGRYTILTGVEGTDFNVVTGSNAWLDVLNAGTGVTWQDRTAPQAAESIVYIRAALEASGILLPGLGADSGTFTVGLKDVGGTNGVWVTAYAPLSGTIHLTLVAQDAADPGDNYSNTFSLTYPTPLGAGNQPIDLVLSFDGTRLIGHVAIGDAGAASDVLPLYATTLLPPALKAALDARTLYSYASMLPTPGGRAGRIRQFGYKPFQQPAITQWHYTSSSTPALSNPLTFTSLSPPSGLASGGNPVSLNGTGFTNVATVLWEGVSISFTVINDSLIHVTAPASLSGIGAKPVQVHSPCFGASGSEQNYTYTNPPTVIVKWTYGPQVVTDHFQFDASTSSGQITHYAWDFGDGTTGTGVNPTHTYSEDTSHAVTLTVTDLLGRTSSVTHTVAS